ncbi:exonuclease SbcC [Salinimicrobium catena]|uniref:Exonuclease SbcC n=1 Tax=Salinimicrobium catena TaxID=390640 RepID=A0A1H5N0U2_9FLAO|nr:AAA family ATPase [Salinimicrobium catena]SDL34118.1 exonuclease SbcC [Salinimicrobium catena]SEE95195.1 exonuclease SbcC [Salinimicrobium catena]
MKILKIEFQNINSLKGTHEIDFSAAPFTSSSLFAITGPTGSGKSTILDVISLALFNQVPRLGRISKNEILNKGAILTRNQKEAFAQVTYESGSGVFASLWSISTNSNNNLRDYEMQIFDLATGKALDLKKSDVPAKNEELIGLNYNQFIKSVLLAQGEFAQFLRAKKDERGELLEKITGTGIYRQVGIRAFQKYKEANAQIEDRRKEIELLQKELLDEEQLKVLRKSFQEKEEQISPLEKQINELEKSLDLKKNIRDQQRQIAEQEKLKLEVEQDWKKFEAENILLQKHEEIQLFAEELRAWRSHTETLNDLQKEISLTVQKEEEVEKGIFNCLKEVSDFIQANSAAEEVEDNLQRFLKNIQQLQQARKEKLSSYENLKRQFDLEVREVPFQLNGDLEASEKKLLEMQFLSRKKLEGLSSCLENIDLEEAGEEKLRLKRELEKARLAHKKFGAIENLSAELLKNHKEQEELLPHLQSLPKDLELKQAQAATLSERLEKLQLKLQNQVLQASLEEHRAHLKDGEPCPLCGALEHPFATDLPQQETGLREELKTTETRLKDLQSKIVAEKTTLQHHEQRTSALQKEAQRMEQELDLQKSEFKEEFSEFMTAEEVNWEELCAGYEEQMQQLETHQQEDRKLKAISAGLPLIEELKLVLEEGKGIKEQLDSLYTGNNIQKDCLDLQNRWTEFQHNKKSLARQKADLEQKLITRRSQLQELEKELELKIKEKGCRSISEALERLLPEARYVELRRQREELNSRNKEIRSALKTLNAQLEKLRENEVEATSEELEQKLQEKRTNLKNITAEFEELRWKIRNDEKLQARIKKIEQSLQSEKQHIRRWELLNQLIGDATGKKFNDFAQDLSLSQLLRLANIRLKDLSDRYKIDKPEAGEDDSLVAIDEHMGGQRRSVKTLSGGETFILSLSMALALSDLASKNVEINSLFIDEGFGTLDPETLDQTLTTLEKLQAESSKTIGIISHVDSLKERIATQVRLKRNGQGYSSLEVTS